MSDIKHCAPTMAGLWQLTLDIDPTLLSALNAAAAVVISIALFKTQDAVSDWIDARYGALTSAAEVVE